MMSADYKQRVKRRAIKKLFLPVAGVIMISTIAFFDDLNEHWPGRTEVVQQNPGDIPEYPQRLRPFEAFAEDEAVEAAFERVDIRVTVEPSGWIDVEERSVARVDGDALDGTFHRRIPLPAKGLPAGGNAMPRIELLRADINGRAAPHRLRIGPDEALVSIGKPDKEIRKGLYRVGLHYRLHGFVTPDEGRDRLTVTLVNAIDSVPVEEVEARIAPPQGSPISSYSARIVDPYDRDPSGVTQSLSEASTLLLQTQAPLLSQDRLAVEMTWPEGAIAHPDALTLYWYENRPFLVALGCLLVFLLYEIVTLRLFGRDLSRAPAKNLGPQPSFAAADLRLASLRSYDLKVLVAGILGLCVKGYAELHDAPEGRQWLVIKAKDGPKRGRPALSASEQSLYEELFTLAAQEVVLEPKRLPRLERLGDAYKHMMTSSVRSRFVSCNWFWRILAFCLLGAGWCYVAWPWPVSFAVNSAFLLAFFSSVTLVYFSAALVTTLIAPLHRSLSPLHLAWEETKSWWWLTIPAVPCSYFILVYVSQCGIAATLVMILSMLLLYLYDRRIQRLTDEGAQAQAEIEALDSYLSAATTTQEDGALTLQQRVSAAERLWPYAVALDLEEAWRHYFRKRFAEVPSETPLEALFPSWYRGERLAQVSSPSSEVSTLLQGLERAIAYRLMPLSDIAQQRSAMQGDSPGS